MKKIILTITFIIMIGGIFWYVLPAPSQPISPLPVSVASLQVSQASLRVKAVATPLLVPSPTPLKLDQNSNLSIEAQKLSVPDYQQDYHSLSQTLSNF